jgi:DNA polymerase-3 subunit chi
MTAIEFIKQRKKEKAPLLCELADEYFAAGKRVLVLVADDNLGIALDRYMWGWRKEAFLPHAFDNGAIDCLDEPVVITAVERNANAARVLILGQPCSLAFLRQFEAVIDFAELHDDALAEAARARYRSYQEAGFAVRMRP